MSDNHDFSRRDWMRLMAAGTVGIPVAGWFGRLAAETARLPQRKKSCILLWMSGGPSQMDTFDLKPGHKNGGPIKEIQTAVPGIRIGEHLPLVAKHVDRMAVIRSMSTKEGDHGRASELMHTGYLQPGVIQYPSIGSLVARELVEEDSTLPGCVSIAGTRTYQSMFSPGFLGPKYAPLVLGSNYTQPGGSYEQSLRVEDLKPDGSVSAKQAATRLGLLKEMQHDFNVAHGGAAVRNTQAAYDRAVRLMSTEAGKAFDLDAEPAALRDRYGRNLFGQGCLLARRLVEQRVPFIQVNAEQLSNRVFGWDTHADNFERVKELCGFLDAGWGTLMADLKDKRLLDSTLVVWAGEFGRTPKINSQNGRDHYPNAWSTVLCGGGIKGGQVVGKTSADGTTVEDRKVSVPDFLATICRALGIDPMKHNQSNIGRPIRIVEKGAVPIKEILG